MNIISNPFTGEEIVENHGSHSQKAHGRKTVRAERPKRKTEEEDAASRKSNDRLASNWSKLFPEDSEE